MLIELALRKAETEIDNNEGGGMLEKEEVRTTRGRMKRARKEMCYVWCKCKYWYWYCDQEFPPLSGVE
jgi:hypothetical protein